MKLSFKKEKRETGLRAVAHPYANVKIRGDGKRIGTIYAPNWQQDGWRVSVMVKESGGNCPFAWMHLGTFNDEPRARDWLKQNWDIVERRYEIHQHEGLEA